MSIIPNWGVPEDYSPETFVDNFMEILNDMSKKAYDILNSWGDKILAPPHNSLAAAPGIVAEDLTRKLLTLFL